MRNAGDLDHDQTHTPTRAAGKSSAVARRYAVVGPGERQASPPVVAALPRQSKGTESSDAWIGAALGTSLSAPQQEFPHKERIEASFGRAVPGTAHVGASETCNDLGAEAYAGGGAAVFRDESPSLHTAAHEAAHLVQQRGGIQLKGAFGQSGDEYERHADNVADLVAAGRSSAHLLAPFAIGGGGSGAVQFKGQSKSTNSTVDILAPALPPSPTNTALFPRPPRPYWGTPTADGHFLRNRAVYGWMRYQMIPAARRIEQTQRPLDKAKNQYAQAMLSGTMLMETHYTESGKISKKDMDHTVGLDKIRAPTAPMANEIRTYTNLKDDVDAARIAIGNADTQMKSAVQEYERARRKAEVLERRDRLIQAQKEATGIRAQHAEKQRRVQEKADAVKLVWGGVSNPKAAIGQLVLTEIPKLFMQMGPKDANQLERLALRISTLDGEIAKVKHAELQAELRQHKLSMEAAIGEKKLKIKLYENKLGEMQKSLKHLKRQEQLVCPRGGLFQDLDSAQNSISSASKKLRRLLIARRSQLINRSGFTNILTIRQRVFDDIQETVKTANKVRPHHIPEALRSKVNGNIARFRAAAYPLHDWLLTAEKWRLKEIDRISKSLLELSSPKSFNLASRVIGDANKQYDASLGPKKR